LTALREIVRTCSNVHVARAALASIGGEFAARFAADASRRDLPSGVLAARMVRAFAIHAGDDERRKVDAVARGADQPVLVGLRYILARGLGAGRTAACDVAEETTPPAWAICAARDAVWRD
jgi:hypothetical protein